jgi:glycine/D-amino acid oxidase-like deaminating enzyme
VSPWLDGFPSKKRPTFPIFKGDVSVPVVVVGSGMTGAMAAYACAAAGARVVLLEAGRVGGGGTAWASGVFASEACGSFVALERQAGRKVARAHFDLTRRAALDLIATVKRLGIKAQLEPRDAIRIVSPNLTSKPLQKEGDERRGAGLEASWQKTAAVSRSVRIESEGGLRLQGWGHLNPFRLAIGFLKAAVDRGAQVFEHSAAMKVAFDRKVATVITAGGRITAEKVLLCTGEPTDLARALKRHFRFTERAHVITAPLPAAVRRAMGPPNVVITDVDRPPHTIAWVDEDRVLVAGAESLRTPERRRGPVTVQRTGQLMYELSRLFPAMSGAPPAHGWLMPLAHSADDVLYAGPHRNFPHQLFAFGTTHDPVRAFLASRILLRHVLNEATREDEHFGFARNL